MMVWKYRQCTPGDCCAEEDFGKPSDKPENRGKSITDKSSTTCSKSKTSKDGNSCQCRYVLHFSEANTNKQWEVKEEKLHKGTKWTDEDAENLRVENQRLSPKGRVVRNLACIEFDADGEPVTLPKPSE
jgi:hypothetical protein